jgi:hypothetical protein
MKKMEYGTFEKQNEIVHGVVIYKIFLVENLIEKMVFEIINEQ